MFSVAVDIIINKFVSFLSEVCLAYAYIIVRVC